MNFFNVQKIKSKKESLKILNFLSNLDSSNVEYKYVSEKEIDLALENGKKLIEKQKKEGKIY